MDEVRVLLWLFVAALAVWLVIEGLGLISDRRETKRWKKQDRQLAVLNRAVQALEAAECDHSLLPEFRQAYREWQRVQDGG